MKLIRNIKLNLFALLMLSVGSANAVIVSFEEQAFVNVATQTFQAANLTMGSSQQLSGITFGPNNGITFSGGVLLKNPTETDPITFDGDVLYGTAFSPTTGAQTSPITMPDSPELPSALTIDITPTEGITFVEGLLINGLNTDRINPATNMPYTSELADYTVNVFTENSLNDFSINIMDLPSNQMGGFDLFSLDTSVMGSNPGMNIFITSIVIAAIPVDFVGQPFEWDFLIDAVSFNEPLPNPVPVPAALPLFLSALLGGWIFARPRKSSESTH